MTMNRSSFGRRQLLTLAAAGLTLPARAQPRAAAPVVAAASASTAKPPAFTHFRVGNRNVKRLFVDGDIVWVGTSGGLVRYDTRADRYRLLDARSGLMSNGVFHVGRVDGRIAVGTYGGGLSLLDPVTERWETFNIPEGLGDAFVYDVLTARNGDLWIATWSGVNRVRGGRLRERAAWDLHTVASTGGGLPNDWVYGLAEGPDGTLWLGTEGGLARLQDGRWQNWNHARGLGADYERVRADIRYGSDPGKASEHHARQKQEMGLANVDVAYNPNYIVSLAVDAMGVVWAGTWGGGLSRFDGERWAHRTVADGLPGNHVFMLHVDPRGRLWAGTDNGLGLLLPDGRFERSAREQGLYDDAVFAMATAPDGSRWVGSYGGVARLAPR
jgi:ligand-binding sensor domain-containing protein